MTEMDTNSDQQPTTASTYDEHSIQILEGLEAVRKRPGMYIGDTADGSGLHHLVYEVVDNSIDEAFAGYATKIQVTIHTDNSISVVDDGRGIPSSIKWDDKHKPKRSAAEIALTELHAGGKFDNNGYKISGGLHGVGVSCVNALSTWLRLIVRRDGEARLLEFERGKVKNRLTETAKDPVTGAEVLISPMKLLGPTSRRGTEVHFLPDTQIFEQITEFNYDTLLAPARAFVPQLRRSHRAQGPAHRPRSPASDGQGPRRLRPVQEPEPHGAPPEDLPRQGNGLRKRHPH